MELYIGDKVVQLNKKKYERLDDKKTKTNITYRNGDEVIKIFKNAILEDETVYRYFVDCNLNLKLVSKPNNLVYDKKINLLEQLQII